GFRCLPDDHPGVAAPLRAGGMVVFSSLTPHRTGPNLSDGIRKAYIVQFAPDGACLVSHDGRRSLPANDPERQFPILVGGRAPRAGAG
ncbi:MAG: phytanoyl-CoA dioxygenase family protein, partial [Myxococcota bacterium]